MTTTPAIRGNGPWSIGRALLAMPQQVRLCWRLLRERRVSLAPKLILVAGLVYVLLPFDLIPDFIPGLGQVDDVTLLVAAAWWFVRWCPPRIVAEHMAALGLLPAR